jgi:predicted nuclease of restriction endonuclease-like (RecB) superfamily
MPPERPRPALPSSAAPDAESAPTPPAAAPPTRDQLPAGYAAFFAEVAARVRAAQLKAAAVNRELIALYWDLGREIVARQAREGWGTGVIARLSADLRREFPGARGFSERNIRSARAFYLAYAPADEAVNARDLGGNRQQPVAEIGGPGGEAPRSLAGPPAAVAAIPWGHNLLLLEQLADPALRLWYAEQTTRNGWSRSVLGLQIETRLHERLGRPDQTTNFAATLPPAQSDLARAVVKDPYNIEFLAVAQDAYERHVEAGLLAHMREFLLELGTGFLYAGSQYRLVVGGDEFFLDLLFYHKKLRCWVVLDLKMGEFRPEDAGQMHFYLNVVDDQLRDPGDHPRIGLILCRGKNAVVAEYALRGLASPMGVAEFRVAARTDALPAELRGALPSLEAVRAELEAAPLAGSDTE